MSVERNKDGSVTIKSENSVCTIGVFCSKHEAMNASPENFGLNIRGYYLPQTEANTD